MQVTQYLFHVSAVVNLVSSFGEKLGENWTLSGKYVSFLFFSFLKIRLFPFYSEYYHLNCNTKKKKKANEEKKWTKHILCQQKICWLIQILCFLKKESTEIFNFYLDTFVSFFNRRFWELEKFDTKIFASWYQNLMERMKIQRGDLLINK